MSQETPALPTTGICPCGAPAVAVLTGRGSPTYPYRSVATCGPCEPANRRWVATAGPPERRTLAAPQREPQTLF